MTTNLLLFKYILAGFTSPVHIGSTAKALLWALPLIAVISIVYQALKLEEIKFADFIKQVLLLFGSILIFMIFTAVIIFIIMKLVIG
jgi:hypothetical protein